MMQWREMAGYRSINRCQIASSLVGRHRNYGLYPASFFGCEMILDDLSNQLLTIDGIHPAKTIRRNDTNDAVIVIDLNRGR